MKLREIYIICKKIYPLFNEDYKKYIKSGHQENLIESASKYLEALIDIELFHDSVVNFYHISKNNIKLSKSEMLNVIDKIFYTQDAIINLCEIIGMEYKENEYMSGLEIKLPTSHSLTDLKKNISDLEFVFTKCPFFQSDEEELKFQNIDIGSIWLDFVVSGVALSTGSILLNNVAAFIDKCFIIRSHRLNALRQKKDIEKIEANMEAKKDLIESINKLYKFEINKAIYQLEEISGRKLKDGEERGLAEQSFEKVEKLIDKGLQVYSTIDSPQETKALFDPLEMKYIDIVKELKMLEKKEK